MRHKDQVKYNLKQAYSKNRDISQPGIGSDKQSALHNWNAIKYPVKNKFTRRGHQLDHQLKAM